VNTGLLFAGCALIWGTTWLAIKFQLDALGPEAGVAIRFLSAAALLALYCLARGIRLGFPARLHRIFLLQGLAGFSLSYLAVYHAEQYLVSGLVAIGYAASPLANLLLSRMAFGTPMSRRVAAGGMLGLIGVVLIFLQELGRVSVSHELLIGAVLTMSAVLLSGVAGLAATRYHQLDVGGWAPLAWAMFYGGAVTTLIGLAAGRSFAIAWSPKFAGSLAFLVVGGSILAFGAYFAVMRRIGLARASYVGVMSTVIAIIISSLAEGFHWTVWTLLGVALALAGNALALLTPGSPPARSVESAR
jgi:drug/metabolite transporter (DMT)-like permease